MASRQFKISKNNLGLLGTDKCVEGVCATAFIEVILFTGQNPIATSCSRKRGCMCCSGKLHLINVTSCLFP